MFEEYQICPYTGLRSFTEEESLYFKGREEHIEQASEQLQRNKFLMLTGASGDGKSSLVYAGIVPNARAGFLKSKYTQWSVADFRPERTPFKNLCRALAKQLEIANAGIVESELQHGFSALVDLYKNSNCYVDVDSVAWQQADDSQRAALKRKSSNLIIIVDQFEEFFTNPENYHNGIPSRDSNLVLNVLLETARIALEEDLPIYIVFTMRSDYIGQCAAFRSLPEYIGFSQFFVPRLNRSQLQQVIEEPAMLSGNRISRRLTERLIHDVAEGVDQLPILQHALNQIWHAADHGNGEMDLIHYAMVGGMSASELPDDQVSQFKEWFNKLPDKIKRFYHEPNLQNVLDTHANKLYESAAGNYRNKAKRELSDGAVKAIIKTTFICLTKIDQSRAVRNRMTLQEITRILGRPELSTKEVGAVLNIFREPGNTFIRPFITEEAESNELRDDDVLDITHESLIRNWEYLEKWAQEEFHDYTVSLDFEQQLNRWVDSGKSGGYLLSIGALTYFENWYLKVKPNIYWIARYLPEEIEQKNKLTKAKEVLEHSQEFLKRSARKHTVTRTVMKYGPRRIAAVFGIMAILTLSSFAVRDYFRRQNPYVLKSILTESLQLVSNPKVVFADRITLIVEELKLGMITIDEVIQHIQDPIEKIHVATGMASMLVFQGGDEPKQEIFQSLALADSLLEAYPNAGINNDNLSKVLGKINELRVTLELAYYRNPDSKIGQLRTRNALRSKNWVMRILSNQPTEFNDIQNVNLALENAINHNQVSDEEINKLLSLLSPFEGNPSDWVRKNYHRDKLLVRGSQDYGFKFNGLYQELAYLYAAIGNSARAIQCVDTLLLYNQNNFQGDYANGADNATNIAAVFFRTGKVGAELDLFVREYCKRKNTTHEDFYARVIGRSLKSYTTSSNLHLYFWGDAYSNMNLIYSSRAQLSFFFSKYRQTVEESLPQGNERNFLLSLSFKNEGILKSLNQESPDNDLSVTGYFDKAVKYYKEVDQNYLDQTISVLGVSAADELIVPRKFLFVYPDIKTVFHPLEPRSYFFFYTSDVFLEYILNNELFEIFYPTLTEMDYFRFWLRDYHQKMWVANYFMGEPIRYVVLQKLEKELSTRGAIDKIDLNFLYMYIGYDAQQAGDIEKMLYYYRQIQPANILNTLRSKEFPGQVNGHSLRLLAFAVEGFAKNNLFDDAYHLMSSFRKPINRSSLYAFAAVMLQLERFNGDVVQRLIDSAFVELNRVENLTTGQPHRQILAYARTLQDPVLNTPEANRLVKNLGGKSVTQQRICASFGFHNKLYDGRENIPPLISATDQAIFNWYILYGYGKNLNQPNESWNKFEYYRVKPATQWIFYIDENI